MNQETFHYLLMALAVVILLKVLLDRAALHLYQQGGTEESREFARIAAFGLILYSVMQDLQHPDHLLGIYWLLICCWFYINNRSRSLEKGHH